MVSASPTAMSMTLRPLIETLIRPVPVVPISRAGTPRALARASTAPTCSRATDTTTRDADSENNVDADAQPRAHRPPARSTVNPTPPVPNEHSASVTARPPSAQSCADRSSPSRAASDQHLLKRLFGVQGPLQAACLRRRAAVTFKYSLPPNSCRVSPSRTIASPLPVKLRPSTLLESSMRPTTPSTGVG